MKKNAFKKLMASGLVLIMSFGLSITAFAATSEADQEDIMAAISEVELDNGTKIALPDSYKSEAKQYLKTNSVDKQKVLAEVDNVKQGIRDTGAVSAADLKTKVENNQNILNKLTNDISAAGEAAGVKLNVDLKAPAGQKVTIKTESGSGSVSGESSDENGDDDSDTVSNSGSAQQTVVPAPSTPVNVTIKKPDGTTINTNEPVIKTTGYDFTPVALFIGAALLLVAGCVAAAHRKNLFS